MSGKPAPQVTWYRDDRQIRAGENVVISKDNTTGVHCMTIDHVTPDDSGVYTALARNQNGKADCSAKLLVKECKLL